MPPAPTAPGVAAEDVARILEHVPAGLALVRDDQIVFVNRSLQLLLGHGDRGALIGAPQGQLVLASPSAEGNAHEERWLRADGAVAVVNVVRTTLPAGGGVLLLVRDSSEESRRGDPHLVVADRLASAGTLAAGVAHQINNPLAYVLTNLGYLADEVPALVAVACVQPDALSIDARLADLERTIAEAREGAERVASIVRDLKLLSHVDDETIGDVDLISVLESACNIVWSQLQARGRVTKTYGALPEVRGNGSRLAQAFVNLLLNAAQAIPEGQSERHRIRITTSTDLEGRAVIEISDTGTGIAPHLRTRIFDPFFTTRAVGVGTGLGLTIAHGIVSGLGGRIVVDSTEGRGSTFRVVLPPATPSPAEARATDSNTAARPARRMRVLLVDDEDTLVSALQRSLARTCDVVATTSAVDALELLLGGEPFDVVLCDMIMPMLSGIDMYERTKSARPDLARRFVFMTGGAFTPRMRAFLDAATNPRLDKPFTVAQLRRAIEKLDEET